MVDVGSRLAVAFLPVLMFLAVLIFLDSYKLVRLRTVLITLRNDTAWWHPMHLHGHSWRELSRNGHALADRPWRDTTLLAPGDTVDVAFVADNPGDWLLHCHVLEHHAGGMGVQFRVA